MDTEIGVQSLIQSAVDQGSAVGISDGVGNDPPVAQVQKVI